MPTADHAIRAAIAQRVKRFSVRCLLFVFFFASAGFFVSLGHAGESQSTSAAATAKPKKEPKLSQRESEELFQSLKSILEFVHNDTKYPIRHPVKHQMTSRDKVSEWLNERMRDEKAAERLDNAELMLKKLG